MTGFSPGPGPDEIRCACLIVLDGWEIALRPKPTRSSRGEDTDVRRAVEHLLALRARSCNLVPLIVTARGARLADHGTPADVAPTILALLGIPQPREMTGRSLLPSGWARERREPTGDPSAAVIGQA